ncbi:MAG TPA: hypothetical protein VLS27_01070, partial [Gammaproteobacteria bacterium]|nr:hypothetical protein [Gammaproteobacteria bacterium]
MNVFKRKFAGFAGYVLVWLTCIFVAIRFVESRPLEVLAQSTTGFLFAVALSGIAYAAISLFLAVAWLVILTYAENRHLPSSVCISAYAQSQIAKYFPGNVFHFVGRHMLGRRIGLSHHSQILAVGLESVGLIAAAASL